jgi:hypothetical protein
MVMLNHFATDYSLLPAIFQGLRFGIKFIFSSKVEIIVGVEGLDSSHVSSAHNSSTPPRTTYE